MSKQEPDSGEPRIPHSEQEPSQNGQPSRQEPPEHRQGARAEQRKAKFQSEVLEPRILLSATWIDADGDDLDADGDVDGDLADGDAHEIAHGHGGSEMFDGEHDDHGLFGDGDDDRHDDHDDDRHGDDRGHGDRDMRHGSHRGRDSGDDHDDRGPRDDKDDKDDKDESRQEHAGTAGRREDLGFELDVSGNGHVDWSYDAESGTLTISDIDGAAGDSVITIRDLEGGDLKVETVNVDTEIGGLVSSEDLGTVNVTGKGALGSLSVGDGEGSITHLNLENAMQDDLDVHANVEEFSVDGDLRGDLHVTGDVQQLSVDQDVHGALTIDGDVTSMDVAGDLRGETTIDGDVQSLHVGGDLRGDLRVNGDAGDLSVQNVTADRITIKGDLGTLSAERIDADVHVGGDVAAILVNDEHGGNDDFGGSLTVGGGVESLAVGDDLAATVNVNGSIGHVLVTGEMREGMTVGGDLDELTAGGMHGDLTVTGNAGRLHFTGSGGKGDFDGTLRVAGDVEEFHAADAVRGDLVIGGNAGTIETGGHFNGGLQVSGNVDTLHVGKHFHGDGTVEIGGTVESVRIEGMSNKTITVDGDLDEFSVEGKFNGMLTVEAAIGTLSVTDGDGDVQTVEFDTPTTVIYDGTSLRAGGAAGGDTQTAGVLFEADFDGDKDGFEVVSGQWLLEDGRLQGDGVGGGNRSAQVAVLQDAELTLPEQFDVEVTLNSENARGGWENGFVIFDYQGENDFKFAGARVGADYWTIGHFDGDWQDDVTLDERIDTGEDIDLQVKVDGGKVTLIADGVEKVSRKFDEPVNKGGLGLGVENARSTFDDFIVRGERLDAEAPGPETDGGLVASWSFNEQDGSSSATDAVSGAASALTNMSGDEWGTGVHEGALQFDGVDDYVHSEQDLGKWLNGTATLSAWVKTDMTGDAKAYYSGSIIGNEQSGGENDLRWGFVDNEGRIGMSAGNDHGARSSEPINDGEWHHVAFTRDAESGEVQVFVDGALSDSFKGRSGEFSGPLHDIGRTLDYNGNDTSYFRGGLDDLQIYDRVLSGDEVASLAKPPSHAPADGTESDAPPTGDAPTDEAPAENPEQPAPVDEQPVDEAQNDDEPATQPPIDEAPSETPVDEQPVDAPAPEDQPVDEPPVSAGPAGDNPPTGTPSSEAPVTDAPTETVPVSDDPIDTTPVADEPTDTIPVSDAVEEQPIPTSPTPEISDSTGAGSEPPRTPVAPTPPAEHADQSGSEGSLETEQTPGSSTPDVPRGEDAVVESPRAQRPESSFFFDRKGGSSPEPADTPQASESGEESDWDGTEEMAILDPAADLDGVEDERLRAAQDWAELEATKQAAAAIGADEAGDFEVEQDVELAGNAFASREVDLPPNANPADFDALFTDDTRAQQQALQGTRFVGDGQPRGERAELRPGGDRDDRNHDRMAVDERTPLEVGRADRSGLEDTAEPSVNQAGEGRAIDRFLAALWGLLRGGAGSHRVNEDPIKTGEKQRR